MNELELIKRELAAVIVARQGQLAANPYDQGLQQQLGTLHQLQSVLNSQYVPPETLASIRANVPELARSGSAQPNPPPFHSVPPQGQWQPPPSIQPQFSYPVRPPTAQQQSHIAPLQPQAPAINPQILNGLQALLANGQKPSTPQLRAAAPELQQASHTQLNNFQSQAASTPALHGADLMAALANSGVLQNLPPVNPIPSISAPPSQLPSQSTAQLLQSLQGLLPPIASQTGTPTQQHAQLAQLLPTTTGRPRISISAANIKTFRPELVHSLYSAQPNQCSTCGRRFEATETGREKKSRHLDWHFRTNQRMADASIARGAHRDWFVNEMEWISLTDFDPSTATLDASGAAAKKVTESKGPKESFVKAPPGTTKNVCSIDFEEMRAVYSEELQEWVFMNAVLWQGKIVHATCLAELQKGQQGGSSLAAALGAAGSSRQRSATPDSSLGKRKADGMLVGSGARARMD